MSDSKECVDSVKICSSGCCKYLVRPYPTETLRQNFPSGHGLRKAGSFVFDGNGHKILLVQSRGMMWGPPKGSIKLNETPTECAVREVKEETGLTLTEPHLIRSVIIKGKALYFLTDMQECEVTLQTDLDDNDANGIGWFHVDCLQRLVETGVMSINHPCRMLIKKVFGKEISFNRDSFVPVSIPGRRPYLSGHYRVAQKEQDDESGQNQS